MMVRRFPKLREDGSCSVAARYSFTDPEAPENLLRVFSEWWAATVADPLHPFHLELVSPPRLDRPCLTNADVVFDARPGSTHWKDVMVMLVGVIRDSDLEVKFVGFYDLVAARMHPASTMIDQS